jgi:DNA-binding CsgD family transcriptional regulator/tetratricopeptide (TPR) repeat protein
MTTLAQTPHSSRLLCPTLVGRERELAALEAFLQEAAAGRPRTVLVAGEAGIGKTALLRSFIDLSRRAGARALVGQCTEFEARRPFSPFVDIVRSAPPRAGELRRLLPEAENAPASKPADESARYRVHDALGAFVSELAGKSPLVLVIEDAQWADESTLELVPHLSRGLRDRRVLFVVSYRSDELHRLHPLRGVLAELARGRMAEEIQLKRLDLQAVGAFLRATLLLDRDPTPAFRQAIQDRCDGNPFFIEEVLKALVDKGEITYLDGHWQPRRDVPELAIPSSIRDAVLGRLRPLTDDAREALQVAAVIGQRFQFDLLARILGREEAALLRDLRLAADAQLIVEDGDEYSFRHALTREGVLAELFERERRNLHRTVGEAIESMAGASTFTEELAYHFDEAHDQERAFCYRQIAAGEATRVFAFARAARHLERAIALAPATQGALGELQLRLAEASFLIGNYADAARAAEEARQLFEREGDGRRAGAALTSASRGYWALGESTTARLRAASAVHLLEPLGSSAELAAVYHELARFAYLEGDNGDAAIMAEKAIAMARDAGAVTVHAGALVTLGSLFGKMGRAEGLVLMREGLAMALKHELPQEIGRGYHNLVLELLSVCDVAAARRLHKEHEEWSERHGVSQQVAEDAAGFAFDDGDFDAVLAYASARTGGTFNANIELLEALVRTARAGPAVGLPLLAEPRRVLATAGPLNRLYGAELEIQVFVLAGEQAQAVRLADSVADVLPRAMRVGLTACATFAAAQLPDRDAWKRWVKLTLDLEDPIGNWSASRSFALGERSAASGEPDDAVRHFEAAAADYRGSLLTFPAMLAELRLIESLLQRDGNGDRERAVAILDALVAYWRKGKATWYLGELERWTAARGLPFNGKTPVEPAASPSTVRSKLTSREREVAALLAEGLTNREIGERLVISERTVEGHVERILGKLEFRSRSQIIVWVTAGSA